MNQDKAFVKKQVTDIAKFRWIFWAIGFAFICLNCTFWPGVVWVLLLDFIGIPIVSVVLILLIVLPQSVDDINRLTEIVDELSAEKKQKKLDKKAARNDKKSKKVEPVVNLVKNTYTVEPGEIIGTYRDKPIYNTVKIMYNDTHTVLTYCTNTFDLDTVEYQVEDNRKFIILNGCIYKEAA